MIDISFKTEDYSEGYYIRKSLKEGDISGDFSDYKVVEIHIINGHNVTLKGDGKLWSVAAWNTDGYAYALGCQSHPMSMAELVEKIKEIK